jgi:hypothetical protein
VNDVSGVHSGGTLLESGPCQGWWLVVEGELADRVVAGPFPDRVDAGWAAGALREDAADDSDGGDGGRALAVYGVRGPDGTVHLRPSPEEWAWLAHLGQQLDRLPADWDAGLPEDDPLVTLVVEVTAVLCEAGLPVHDATGAGPGVGGVCLLPEPGLDGVVVTWRQHDRMSNAWTSSDQTHGVDAHALVNQVMDRAVADLLALRGFAVAGFPGGSGTVVRWGA